MSVLLIVVLVLAGLIILTVIGALALSSAAGRADRHLEQIMDEEIERMNSQRMRGGADDGQDVAAQDREYQRFAK